MQKILFPPRREWTTWCRRPELAAPDLQQLTRQIFETVRDSGDEAVLQYTRQFDGVNLSTLLLKAEAIAQAAQTLTEPLKQAIDTAYRNIRTFHQAQRHTVLPLETMPGIRCWSEARAIEKVGLYIPGGSAPLFSTLLMLGIPAMLAGCTEIVLCTPPNKEGRIDPAICYTAQLIGIRTVVCAGGIQAIAALTFGTESIPSVYKIFGPGNQYVTAAKQFAQQYGVAIDLPAGPSEVLVIADDYADPEFVAADLLAQAEHGPDSQVMVLSPSEAVIDAVQAAVTRQLPALPRQALAARALQHSLAVVLPDLASCIDFSNTYAPEHLILNIAEAGTYIPAITQAGSVFIGPYSCESAGDYASGTNHTLPTNGYARNYSGVSLDSFLRKITFQEISKSGLQQLGPAIEEMAQAEQLWGHKQAVSIRLSRK